MSHTPCGDLATNVYYVTETIDAAAGTAAREAVTIAIASKLCQSDWIVSNRQVQGVEK